MKLIKLAAALAVVTTMGVSTIVHASQVLDQNVDMSMPANSGVSGLIQEDYQYGPLWAGQTFTSGIDGTLSSISFAAYNFGFGSVSNNAGIKFSLWKDFTGYGQPSDYSSATLLANFTLDSATLASNWDQQRFFQTVDLRPLNISQSIGDSFAFEFHAVDGYSFGTMGVTLKTPYAGGHSYGTNVGNMAQSLYFSTYVDVPSPVPAPPAFILMLTGLGILGLTKRFRKADKEA
jgi:hypothetical protein